MSKPRSIPNPFAAGSRSLVFRTVFALGASLLLLAVVAALLFNLWQDHRLTERIREDGKGFLSTLVANSQHSLSKGQRESFQRVLDNFAHIEEVEAAALFARSGEHSRGLMTYRSNMVTVGKPFVRKDGGDLGNPNREPYRESHGRYRRPDWDSGDVYQTPAARQHLKKVGNQDCGNCHVTIDPDLTFDEQGQAFRIHDQESVFYQSLTARKNCTVCHTHWQEGENAGYLMVRLDNGFALQQKRESLAGMVSVLGVAFLLVLATTAILFRGMIYRPLNALIHSTQDLAHGEGDLTRRLERDQGSEFGRLSELFNRFVAKIADIVRQIRDQAHPLAETSDRLGEHSQELQANAQAQSQRTEDITSSIQEVNQVVQDVAENVTNVSEAASQVNQAAQEGARSTSQASEQMDSLQTTTGEVTAITAKIEEIAKKTDLLALNAAIEAANAGEAGQGFAVVADEVRQLADSTAQAIREINQIVDRFREEVDRNRATMGELEESMGSIRSHAEHTDELANQIASAAEELAATMRETAGNVDDIHNANQSVAGSVEQIREEADQLARMSHHMEDLVGKFRID